MTKLEKAVEVVRGWSDEELKEFIMSCEWCPSKYGLKGSSLSKCNKTCHVCWNEEVEE